MVTVDRGTQSDSFTRRHRGWLWTVAVAAVVFGIVVWLGDRDRDDPADAVAAAADGGGPAAEEQPTSPAPEPSATTPDSTPDLSEPLALRHPGDVMALGDVDAPIVIVEWLDMRCPFCALFSRETLPALIERYVDSGQVRYVVRDVALFGDQSIDAAVAARAAGEQGRFHEFVTAVYAAAPERGHAELSRDRLVEFAAEAGVADVELFRTDLDRDDLRQAVQHSTATAGQIGVTSVPFFLVGDVAFAGAQGIDVFEQMIASQVAELAD